MTIDLSRLPPPVVIETPPVEAMISEIKAIVGAGLPEIADRLDDPSDFIVKMIEIFAAYLVIQNGRHADQAKGTMLAYAWGATLDQLGALFGVERLLVSPGDPDARPPVAPSFEADHRLRSRIQMALEGFTTCGTLAAYRFHALSVDGRIGDAAVSSPFPGVVRVVFAASEEDGTPTDDPLDAVVAALNAETVRPLCDTVLVRSAAPVVIDVSATLRVLPGPDRAVVAGEAEARLRERVGALRLVGRDLPRSAIYAALHDAGVSGVVLASPSSDVVVGEEEVAVLGEVALTVTEVVP
jgi:phage-related baseplate assembly protein